MTPIDLAVPSIIAEGQKPYAQESQEIIAKRMEIAWRKAVGVTPGKAARISSVRRLSLPVRSAASSTDDDKELAVTIGRHSSHFALCITICRITQSEYILPGHDPEMWATDRQLPRCLAHPSQTHAGHARVERVESYSLQGHVQAPLYNLYPDPNGTSL